MNYADTRSDPLSPFYGPPINVKASPKHELESMFADMARALRRNVPIIVMGVTAGLIAASVYTAMRHPVYRATATLLIDPARPNVLASQQVTELPMIDSGFVDSATEIINADFIAQDVVSKMKLGNDPDFTKPSKLRSLLSLISPPGRRDQREADAAAASFVSKNLDARRVGVSYVIEVSFSAENPETAARVANAVVDSYISTQAKARLDAALRASDWLSVRTEELRLKVAEADTAVQRYRTSNNLEESAGKLPVEQQLSELTSKLSAAKAQMTEAHVAAEQIASLIAQGNLDAAAIAAPPDTSVRKVRAKLVDLAAREANISERVGKQHRLALDAHRETEAAREELSRELSSYAESLQKSAQSADAAVAELQSEISKISANKSQFEEKSIALRELERNAESFRQLYETFMGRQKEVSQQQSFAPQDVRVAAIATPPAKPANKPLSMVFAGALGLGLLGGLSAALLRSRLDRSVRSVEDVTEATDRRTLASIMDVSGGKPVELLRHVVTHPLDAFAESFRHLRVALLGDRQRPIIIGITSAESGEGATTITSNFGQYLALSGERVLVIDCNLRKPALSQALCPDFHSGLPEALTGKKNWRELLRVDPVTGFTLLPALTQEARGNLAELLATTAFGRLMNEASREFDVVLLDLASFADLYDARAVAPHVEKFVVVIRSGKTSGEVISQALAAAPEIHDKLAGAVLNRIDAKEFRRFRRNTGAAAKRPV